MEVLAEVQVGPMGQARPDQGLRSRASYTSEGLLRLAMGTAHYILGAVVPAALF